MGQRGDSAPRTLASFADYGEGSGEERPRGKRQPTNTDPTALFGASVASREPAVALATARVTILVCVVIFFIFLLSALVCHVWGCGRGFGRGLSVCFGGLSFGSTPKLGVTRCVSLIYKILLWHSNGGATAPPKAHSDYNFLPQFSLNL